MLKLVLWLVFPGQDQVDCLLEKYEQKYKIFILLSEIENTYRRPLDIRLKCIHRLILHRIEM